VLSLIGWLTIDPVFSALGAGPEVLGHIHEYLDIYYPSVVLMTLTMVASNIMRANGSAGIPGTVMTVGSLVNLALDPILIFGWFGMPRMELAGAATAALIARVITAGVLLRYVTRGRMIATDGILSGFWSSCRRILHVGLPAIATQLIGPVSGICWHVTGKWSSQVTELPPAWSPSRSCCCSPSPEALAPSSGRIGEQSDPSGSPPAYE
jgi:Na+-driven multidrug efflux pump